MSAAAHGAAKEGYMKITKFGHACVLVEIQDGTTTRTALFDPGLWSNVPLADISNLDDIFISHGHPDHIDMDVLKALVVKFPNVRITAPTEVVTLLHANGFPQAADVPPEGAAFFVSPHEGHAPFMTPPQEIGIHFMGAYSHPGDSHSFTETMPVLGLPVQAPWGSMMGAVDVALKLKPKYVIPLHDWHWRDEAKTWSYDRLEQLFGEQGITFLKPVDGQPLDVAV